MAYGNSMEMGLSQGKGEKLGIKKRMNGENGGAAKPKAMNRARAMARRKAKMIGEKPANPGRAMSTMANRAMASSGTSSPQEMRAKMAASMMKGKRY